MILRDLTQLSHVITVYFYFLLEPSFGPDNVLYSQVNKTAFNISWAPLPREKSYGKVILYNVNPELLSRLKRQKRSANSGTINTTETFVVLYGLQLCSKYNVSVQAYTIAGPGPYSQAIELETSSECYYLHFTL